MRELTSFFLVSGRVNRQKYFLLGIAELVLIGLCMLPLHIGFDFTMTGNNISLLPEIITITALFIFFFVYNVCLQIRRCHDLDLVGWWTLMCFVPIANIIFPFVLFFKRGTKGPNRFGEDPLQPKL